jgi:hypothetical protein
VRITQLQIIFQSRVSPKARKNVIRRDDADGPYRNRKVIINKAIPIGPDSGANLETRRLVSQALHQRKQGENLFYVVAEFDRENGTPRYFKTIVPRDEIPPL